MIKEKATITLSYDEERLAALRLYLAEKKTQVEDELTKSLDALYGRTVPQPVRHYLELRGGERPSQPLKRMRQESQTPALGEEVMHDGE